jgi:hypothetical protein
MQLCIYQKHFARGGETAFAVIQWSVVLPAGSAMLRIPLVLRVQWPLL